MNSSRKLQRRFGPRLRKFALALAFVLICSIIFATHQLFFTVRQLICNTANHKSCPDTIKNALSDQKGKSLFLINQKNIKLKLEDLLTSKETKISFKLPGKLIIDIKSNEPIPASFFLVASLPSLSQESSSSASLVRPMTELNQFISTLSAQPNLLLPNGNFVAGGSNGKLNLIFSQKPTQPNLKKTYQILAEIDKNFSLNQVFLLDHNLFLDLSDLPNVIISLNLPEDKLLKGLQSLPALAKIKMDAKIIDLRFNNPVIR